MGHPFGNIRRAAPAYKSGRLLGSGDRKPHLASSMHDVSMEGDVQSPRCERGESVALSTDEVSAQQLDVTLHGCRGGPAVEADPPGNPVARSPRVSNLGNSRLEESEATSVRCVAEDLTPGAEETPASLGKAQESAEGFS